MGLDDDLRRAQQAACVPATPPRTKLFAPPSCIERFHAYHQENPSWGVLHVALDDGNLDDDSVDSCIAFAEEERDVEGLSLALILRKMNDGQRELLASALD